MSGRHRVFMTALGWLMMAASLGGVLLAAPDEAVAIKLNPSLVAGGAVLDAQLTPDGNRVVYLADQETNGVAELYTVPATGGAATKLNRPLVAGGAVHGFNITPNGSRVVFLADQDVSGVIEIYSVPVAGGVVTRLNDPLISLVGGNVTSFQFTPDGSRVVYLADQDTADHFELYGVPVAGGAIAKLNGPDIVLGGSVLAFQISSNGTRVVFRADLETNNQFELYSAPVAGGSLTKLNPPLAEDVVGFEIAPNGTEVVYRAPQDDADVVELYIVPIAGGTVRKLNGPLPADFAVSTFQITPDGSRVVYRARREIPQPPPADEIVTIEIYSVALAGGPATKLNKTLPAGGSVVEFQITPDSSRVVYRSDQDTDNVFELYSVPVQGGTVTKLNPPLVAGGNVLGDSTSTPLLSEGFQITPDGGRVVYRADQTTDTVNELFSVPVAGGVATTLNPTFTLESGHDVAAFLISPDGTRVVYLADQDDNGTNELFSVPVAGGTSTKVSQSLADGRTIIGFEIGPNSRRVTYLDAPFRTIPPDPDPVQELYSVEISSFTDVSPDDVLLPSIEALVRSGITGGCGINPARFCPNIIVTRAQMAVFMVRGIDGPSVVPPAATGTRFTDVPANAFGAAYIERFSVLGITSGCQASPPRYCPDQGLTREQMAPFLLRAVHGAGYQPPAATGTTFVDVPIDHPFGAWIEQLAREGITTGCAANPARYCPEAPLTRGQIAAFLVRTFHLPL
jgi:Tol biopolymer transport system component